jgi:predicted nucleotidyltransferase
MEESKAEDDQRLVEAFLEEFARKLASLCDIDFILLFGSAARGEWKKGISDVDMVIQAVRQEDKERIREVAEKLFWEFDDKYGTEFRKVCSIAAEEGDSALERVVKKGQSTARLYTPFEVLGPEDVDWERGELKSSFLKLGVELVAPKYLLFTKMKVEGRVIYGGDITRVINPRVNWFDRAKAILVPHHLSFFSVLLSPFSPRMTVRLAIKSAIYSVESCLYYLKKPVGRGIPTAMAELEREIGGNRWVDVQHIRKLYELKYSKHAKQEFSRFEAFVISLKTFVAVVKLNWWTVLHRLKTKLSG